jgi:prepilin-type N-terminal cleavage/methylation domain-containing protein
MKLNRKNAGFTLIELMIVVAIIAIIASIAIPKLMSARISANENAAIATLRSIASAQAQIESASAIDTDADGGGEFAYFGELAGVANLRIYDPATDAPTIGADVLTPAILPTAFGEIVVDGATEGVVERAGYFFKMYLPGLTAGGVTPGIAEDGTADIGGATAGSEPDPDDCEILWCCYAWPVSAGKTGNRAFFINQEGDLLQTGNVEGNASAAAFFYSGLANGPLFDAAFSNETGGGDMGTRIGITAMLTPLSFAANDGNTWTVVGN